MKSRPLIFAVFVVLLAGCASDPVGTDDSTVSSQSPAVSPPLSPSPTEQATPTTRSAPASVAQSPSPRTPSPTGSTDLPTANANGDYSQRTDHLTWVVVDPGEGGLNCRWSETMPANWYDPQAELPPLTIEQWPVVRQFPQGTTVTANVAPAGFAMLTDDQNRPWLKVSIGPNEQICLVRANAQYVKPAPQ